MRLLHLSDLHISRDPGPDAEGVDARVVLAQLLHDCRHVTDIDLVLVSGDIADDGSREGYTDALDLVESFARQHGATQAWCVGNHDGRDAFSAVLGTGHRDRDGQDVGRPATVNACAATSVTSGIRIITLDSLVPGDVFGRIGPEQLGWLRAGGRRDGHCAAPPAYQRVISVGCGEPAGRGGVRGRPARFGRPGGPYADMFTRRSAASLPGCLSGSDPACSRGST